MEPLPQGIPPLRPNLDPLNPHTEPSRVNPDAGKQSSDADQPSSSETHKDQKKQELPAEKTPEALKHAQASKLAGWVKQSAALLQQLEKKASPAENKPELKFRDEVEQLEDGAVREGIAEGQLLADQTIGTVGGSLNLLGADVNMEAVSGFSYASTIGKELTAGIDLLGSKWKLNNLKLEKEAIQQQIDDFLEQMDELLPEEQKVHDPALAELTRKKMHVDEQIYQMEKSDWKKAASFLITHLESVATAVVAVLRQTHDNAGLIAASGGGTGIGAFGMLASTGGVFKGILNYSKIDDQMVDIIKVSEKHENPNVSNAIGAVKTVALDHTASHQKNNIVIEVLQNAFTFCQSGISTAMGIITLVSLTTAGTAVGTGAATAAAGLSPGLPAVMGIGLLIAGAVAIYKNRHTIGRGIKELRAGNYSLERNLAFRQWKRQNEFKFISRKLLELGEQHAKLEAGTASNKSATEKAREVISQRDGSFFSTVGSVARAGGIIAKSVISELGEGFDNTFFAGESRHVFKIDQGDNSGDGAKGLEFEMNRISAMRTKVKSDLFAMRNPGRNEFHGLAEILDRKRAELVENIEILKTKETQVQNQILIQLGIDEDPNSIELNEFDDGVLVRAPINPKAIDSSQQRLVEAIKVLGEGDELREFAAVFEKMGVSFQDMDSRQHKNLYVQTQIQKAITAQTIVWN